MSQVGNHESICTQQFYDDLNEQRTINSWQIATIAILLRSISEETEK